MLLILMKGRNHGCILILYFYNIVAMSHCIKRNQLIYTRICLTGSFMIKNFVIKWVNPLVSGVH